MFARIRNTPVDYAWGADGEITRLLGDRGACRPASGTTREAELWLGAHHGSPSQLVDPAACGGAVDLPTWIAADPELTLGPLAAGLREGDGARLPFLMKVLSAGRPLSLQAHPSLAEAREGFARENAAGIPLDAPHRSYRDPSHKPELLLALSETMEALAGFRPHAEAVAAIEGLAARGAAGDRTVLDGIATRVRDARDDEGRLALVAELLGCGEDARAAAHAITAAAEAVRSARGPATTDAAGAIERDAGTVLRLAREFPGDPGIVIALLLNRVTLRRGEAIFVGAGSMHAYLAGLGLEVMAASDNVLRGGLTPKHIDVPELVRVLDASTTTRLRIDPVAEPGGLLEFVPDVADFQVARVTRGRADGPTETSANAGDAPARIVLDGPAIALCLDGEATLAGERGAARLAAGEAVYVTPDEGALEVSGGCDLVVAGANRAATRGGDRVA